MVFSILVFVLCNSFFVFIVVFLFVFLLFIIRIVLFIWFVKICVFEMVKIGGVLKIIILNFVFIFFKSFVILFDVRSFVGFGGIGLFVSKNKFGIFVVCIVFLSVD